MNVEWYRLLSWHAVVPNRGLQWRALCGRPVTMTSEVRFERPAGKSCESCLRIIERAQEKQ
jgi:hypothetical protein